MIDQDDLRAASDALKSALSVANSKRFSKGFLGGVADWFRTPNYDEYSDGEIWEMQSMCTE